MLLVLGLQTRAFEQLKNRMHMPLDPVELGSDLLTLKMLVMTIDALGHF